MVLLKFNPSRSGSAKRLEAALGSLVRSAPICNSLYPVDNDANAKILMDMPGKGMGAVGGVERF